MSASPERVTAICRDAKNDVAFYIRNLGLRLVKQIVNEEPRSRPTIQVFTLVEPGATLASTTRLPPWCEQMPRRDRDGAAASAVEGLTMAGNFVLRRPGPPFISALTMRSQSTA
jgi:catechol 2,3-dioxygenase-like lactoylglutathione lyase family enzyme